MRIYDLKLKNIGPLEDVNLNFISEEDDVKAPPAIIITGENGTGKTLILDAIRSLLFGPFGDVGRDITSSDEFLISATVSLPDNNKFVLEAIKKNDKEHIVTNNKSFNYLFTSGLESNYSENFILNYWTSRLSTDPFKITNIEKPTTKKIFQEALSGVHKNTEVTKLLTFFDYLSESKDEKESAIGRTIINMISRIINLAIENGELAYISRTDLTPIISIGSNQISLDKLSSGNLYILQRFIHIVKQIYSIWLHNKLPIEEISNIQGLLLIDEAENHLHPKWQKVFLSSICKIFPRVQLIVTTHSPFIVSSIENSKIFVCKTNGVKNSITEETDYYVNKPIEQILISPLFDTNNFNADISDLLKQRKKSMNEKDTSKVQEIEKKLLDINPDYFNFLNLDEVLSKINIKL